MVYLRYLLSRWVPVIPSFNRRACSIMKVISPIKAKVPAPAGKNKRRSLTDDDDLEDDVANVAAGTAGNTDVPEAIDSVVPPAAPTDVATACASHSPEVPSKPKTADAAGAVAAAEIFQLESLVTMGDGKQDAYTCHCWGLEGTLWAVNEPGQLVGALWRTTSISEMSGYVVLTVANVPT